MDYTKEQSAIINETGRLVVVRALAGTGKTSTLLGYAKSKPHVRMLYIVLNKSVQKEAEQKFKATGVKPMTSHGLAFRYTGSKYQHKLAKGNLKPYEIESALGISKELQKEIGYYGSYNDNMVIASIVLETLTKFLYSPDKEIQIILYQAERLWTKMIDTEDSTVPMIHDGYLKLFQLSNPVLSGYDEFLVDEAQDSNPCTLSIIFKQTGKIVLVGDDQQAIYGWRGARNALAFAIKQGAEVHYLTGSFRFGENIARVANAVLDIKGVDYEVRGLGGQDKIGRIEEDQQKTIISRTNAGVFSRTAQAINNEKSWWHVGGSEGYRFDQILDVYYLWNRMFDSIRDPFIKSFTDFTELKLYVEDVGDPELKPRCRIAEEYGDAVPVIVDKIKGKVGAASTIDSADTVLGTCHKMKGLEADNVLLDDDFIELCELTDILNKASPGEKAEQLRKANEELNILYVGVTRAKKVLQLNMDLFSYFANKSE